MTFNEEKGMEIINAWFIRQMTGPDEECTAKRLFENLHQAEEPDDALA